MVLIKTIEMKVLLITILCFGFIGQVSAQKNTLTAGIGYGGADGIDINPVYDITYRRDLTKIWALYATYAISAGESEIPSDIYQGTVLIGPNNTADDPVAMYSQWHSYGVGVQANVVRYTVSTLSLQVGLRAQQQHKSEFISSGSKPEQLRVAYESTGVVGLEVGIAYRRKLSRQLTVGGTLYAMPADFLFGGAFTAGVFF